MTATTLRLGDRATDIVSGLSGILTSRVEHLTSTTEYCLLLKAEDGKSPDTYWVSEARLLARSIQELQELKGE